MSDKIQRTRAEHAVLHILMRLQADPRLAYLIGPGAEESYELLIDAGAEALRINADIFRTRVIGWVTTQPVPGIGESAAVIDLELIARIEAYDRQSHDLDSQDDINMLANHFIRRGLDVAEAERDTQTEELF